MVHSVSTNVEFVKKKGFIWITPQYTMISHRIFGQSLAAETQEQR